jgi:hypothetical protein
MAMAMRRYVTVHIARWRRFRSFKNPTKRHHWVSIVADNDNWSHMCRFFYKFFHCQLVQKGRRSSQRPLFSIGVLHIKQTKASEKYVGGV